MPKGAIKKVYPPEKAQRCNFGEGHGVVGQIVEKKCRVNNESVLRKDPASPVSCDGSSRKPWSKDEIIDEMRTSINDLRLEMSRESGVTDGEILEFIYLEEDNLPDTEDENGDHDSQSYVGRPKNCCNISASFRETGSNIGIVW